MAFPFNFTRGGTMRDPGNEVANTLELYTDSAGSKGYGAVFGNHWLCGAWPPSWQSLNIATLELFPIVIALHIWGPTISHKCVLLFTDNVALVDIINKQTSKDEGILILLRSLVLCCLRFNILFRFRHIPGFLNRRADSLSRFQVAEFKALTPRRGHSSDSCARRPTAREVVDTLQVLVRSSISEGSKKTHQRAWSVYSQFSGHFGGSLIPTRPLSPAAVALFISYLSASKLAPSSISSYISALSYAHKLSRPD